MNKEKLIAHIVELLQKASLKEVRIIFYFVTSALS